MEVQKFLSGEGKKIGPGNEIDSDFIGDCGGGVDRGNHNLSCGDTDR